jgi:hypothetical protein
LLAKGPFEPLRHGAAQVVGPEDAVAQGGVEEVGVRDGHVAPATVQEVMEPWVYRRIVLGEEQVMVG